MHQIQSSQLRVSTYDRMQGFLVSAILVFGLIVVSLFVVWWSYKFHQPRYVGTAFRPVNHLEFSDASLDKDVFDLGDLPPTAAPRLSSDVEAISDVISKISANNLKSFVDGFQNSDGAREVGPSGLGSEMDTPGIPGVLSESKRWSMFYQNPNMSDYILMLEFFDIEIGVVRLKSNEVFRVMNPGNGFQVTKSARAAEKSSFYFCNTKSTARRWDSKIVRDLSVDLNESVLVHFYSEQSLQKLRDAESNRIELDGKAIEDVIKTKFVIVPTESGFEFQVVEIRYR